MADKDSFDFDELSLVTPQAEDFTRKEPEKPAPETPAPETPPAPAEAAPPPPVAPPPPPEIKVSAPPPPPPPPEIKVSAPPPPPPQPEIRVAAPPPVQTPPPRMKTPAVGLAEHREIGIAAPPPPPPASVQTTVMQRRVETNRRKQQEKTERSHTGYKFGCTFFILIVLGIIGGGYWFYSTHTEKFHEYREKLEKFMTIRIWKERVSDQRPDAAGAANAEATETDDLGRTKLHRAAKAGDLQEVKRLIGIGAEVKKADQNGDTVLHYAIIGNNSELVEYLLAQPGIEVNAVNRKGVSPLHNAASTGNPAVIDLLLRAKADRRLKDAAGRTPADCTSDVRLKRRLR